MLVIGSDVWSDGAEEAALRLAETAGLPVITNGMGRGILPAGHPLLVTRARSVAFGQADLVVVVGAPLDFRLGYGVFGAKDDAPGAPVVHLADSPGQVARHVDLAGSAAGDLGLVLDGLLAAWQSTGEAGQYDGWLTLLQDAVRDSAEKDRSVLAGRRRPDPPRPRLRRAAQPPRRRLGRDR